jgi:hypothetical protein
MDISTASTTSMAGGSEPQSLLKFCLLWTVLHRSSPPDVCNSVADYHQAADLDKVFFNNHHDLLKTLHHGRPHQEPNLINSNSNSKEAGNNDNSFQFHFKHSSRSLSVIGVLGGIVLILFFVALSTCIKHRRNVNAFGDRYHHRENLAREMLVDHIRQLRSNYRGGDGNRTNPSDRPPSYEDVVKDPALADEVDNAIEDPPSYVEAIGAHSSGIAGAGASTSVDASSAASSLNSTTLESQNQPNTSSLTTVVTVEAHSTT